MQGVLPDLTGRDALYSAYSILSTYHDLVARPISRVSSGHNALLHNGDSRALSHTLVQLSRDEQQQARENSRIGVFGQSWLKPPGVSKTLQQMNEERREMDEHRQALNREQLHVDATVADNDPLDGDMDIASEDVDEARDLDDDIPEGDDGSIGADDDGLSSAVDTMPSPEPEIAGHISMNSRVEHERALQDLRAVRMGINDDTHREIIARGEITDGEDDEQPNTIESHRSEAGSTTVLASFTHDVTISEEEARHLSHGDDRRLSSRGQNNKGEDCRPGIQAIDFRASQRSSDYYPDVDANQDMELNSILSCDTSASF